MSYIGKPVNKKMVWEEILKLLLQTPPLVKSCRIFRNRKVYDLEDGNYLEEVVVQLLDEYGNQHFEFQAPSNFVTAFIEEMVKYDNVHLK